MLRILIVDDHALIRRGLEQILREEFPTAQIQEAGNADEAIKRIIYGLFDVIICDLSMPGKSGLEVVQHVKQNNPKLPVLILSMHPEEQYAIRALKSGAAGYLCKDVANEELVKAVQQVLHGRKYISPSIAEKLIDDLEANKKKTLHNQLSQREFLVFQLLSEGRSVSEIAEKLSLSLTTVSTYRSRILIKMEMKTNAELIRYALENKLF